jgi:hypothetical protein
MKRCTYCGKEHDDTATACAIDGKSLVKVFPSPEAQWRYQYPAVSSLRIIVGATIGAGVFGALLLLVMTLSLPLPLAMLTFVAAAG